MKKLLTILVCAVLTLILSIGVTGCKNGGEGKLPPNPDGDNPGGENPVDPSPGPDENTEGAFTATLIYEGETFVPQSEISALWTSDDGSSISKAEFNSDGVATVNGLDGDYSVTLSALPEGYTYNPNIYTVSNENRDVKIELYKILPTVGKGTDKYKNIITLSRLGAYRLTFTKADQQIFCQYKPSKNGVYTIESVMDVNANEVNPRIDIYMGTDAWKPEKPTRSIDGGGASSVYTKNFKYQVTISDSEKGAVYAFAVKFDSRVELPVYIDFIITRNGSFENQTTSYELVVPQASLRKAPDYNRRLTYFGLDDTPNGVLDGNRVKIAEDGYYHLVDESGNVTDRILYAQITQPNKVVNFQEPLVAMKFNNKDYTFFIRGYGGLEAAKHPLRDAFKDEISYYDCVNKDGACAVTEELKEFLQEFCLKNMYFYDGMGWAENLGYNSTDKNMWLCFCGYYK